MFNRFVSRKFVSGISMEDVFEKLKKMQNWRLISDVKYVPEYKEPYRALVQYTKE